MPAVLHPEAVVVQRRGHEPVVLLNVDAISIVGGVTLPPDARFRVGYKGPEAIGLVLRGGERQRIDDVQVVFIKGGMTEADLARKKVPVIGGGGNTRRMIVDDGGIGLGQIDNVKEESEYIDEIDKYLLDKSKALQAVGGDEFYGRIQMGQNARVELNQQAAFTRNNPASIVESMMGGQATRKSGQPPVMVANWIGKSIESCIVNVVFTPVGQVTDANRTVSGLGQFLRPYGIVRWGNEGALAIAEVDIGTGRQFSVGGSMVSLSVAMEEIPGTNIYDGSMTLAGMLSIGTVARAGSPITRTLYLDDIVGGGTATFRVPPFAKKVSLWRTPVTSAATLRLWGAGSTLEYSFLLAANAYMLDPIPLSDDIIFVQVNDTGGAGLDGRLIFELDF